MQSREPFRSWIEAWRGPLIGLLASWGVPWRDAVELAQDSFAEAWLARGRFEGELVEGEPNDLERAGAWLRGIAWNLQCNWGRARRRHADIDELELPEPEADEDERLTRLRLELGRLPSKERTVLCMHYLEETDVRRVAALLGVSEKTVEGRLYRGRKLLRERMALALEEQR